MQKQYVHTSWSEDFMREELLIAHNDVVLSAFWIWVSGDLIIKNYNIYAGYNVMPNKRNLKITKPPSTR